MDYENQIDDKLKRKRELTNARVKKHRKKKLSQQMNSSMQNNPTKEMQKKQVIENNAERIRVMAKERMRRFRERKRLNVLKSVQHEVHDSQIPGASNGNRQTMIHKSQIAGISTKISIPLAVRDDLENLNHMGENLLSPLNEENDDNDNIVPLEDQVGAQPNRSSASYIIQNEFGNACKICNRLWFKKDLKNLNDDSLEFVRTFLSNIGERSIAVCSTCRTSIQKKSTPKMAVYKGLEYPKIPNNLQNLMQIRRLGHVDGQYGQVIDVPVEVDTMVNKLPRNNNDDHFLINNEASDQYIYCKTPIFVSPIEPLNTGEDAQRDQEGVQNTAILCKNCQNVIVGFRYKCITCEDYDLCKKCEMMETHSEHYVLRIPKPLKCKESEEIAQKLQQMFKPDEDIPPIKIKEEVSIGVRIGECGDDEPIQDDNVDEDIHSMEQLKNITHSEASRVIDKSKDVGEPTGTVRRKRKRTAERETVGDGKRMSDADAKVNVAPEIAFADANSDSKDSYIEVEIKQETGEESEMISRLDVGETVNPYVKENQL